MGLTEEIAALKSKTETQLHALSTKEKTKNALFLPFVKALGYDPFDVREVEPEFAVDVGGNEQMKVDYAIKKGGTPVMLFECKEAGTDLSAYDADPLFRYFSEIEARIGVLTNGIKYRFFADLEDIGIDERPFLTFNLLDHRRGDVRHLEQMQKATLDVDEVVASARDTKYKQLFKDYLDLQWKGPDEKFVRFMAERVSGEQVSEGFHDTFGPIVQEALQEFVQNRSEDRPEPSRQEETPHSVRQTDEPTSIQEEPQKEASTPSRERRDLEQKDLKPAGQADETPAGETVNGEESGHGPFEKNLAARVIDDF